MSSEDNVHTSSGLLIDMTSHAQSASGWKTGAMLEVKGQTNPVPTLSIEALV